MTTLERILSKVEEQDGCLVFKGTLRGRGYGTARVDGRSRPTHRLVYEAFVGPVPEGLQLDHLCRNRACCNPLHLEPVTQRENLMRGEGLSARNAKATHCIRGHEFTPENTYYGKNRYSGGTTPYRKCRACARARDLERNKGRRAVTSWPHGSLKGHRFDMATGHCACGWVSPAFLAAAGRPAGEPT